MQEEADFHEANPYAAPASRDVSSPNVIIERRIPIVLAVGTIAYAAFTGVLFSGSGKDSDVGLLFLVVLLWLVVSVFIGRRNLARIPLLMCVAVGLQVAVIGIGISRWGMIGADGAVIVGVIMLLMIATGFYYAIRSRHVTPVA